MNRIILFGLITAFLAGCGSTPFRPSSPHLELRQMIRRAYGHGDLLDRAKIPAMSRGAIVIRPKDESTTRSFLLAYLKRQYLAPEIAEKLSARYSEIKPGTISAYIYHPAIYDNEPEWLTNPPSRRDGIMSIVVPGWHLYLFDDSNILAPDMGYVFGTDVSEAAKALGLDYSEIEKACAQ